MSETIFLQQRKPVFEMGETVWYMSNNEPCVDIICGIELGAYGNENPEPHYKYHLLHSQTKRFEIELWKSKSELIMYLEIRCNEKDGTITASR